GSGNCAVVNYAYDLKGQLTAITYPGGTQKVTRTLDSAGRVTAVTDWNGNTTTFGYDADSNPTTWTYPNTVIGNWVYNNADKLSSVTYTTGTKHTVFLQLTYTRDANNQLTSENSQAFGYDSLNRLTSTSP